MPTSWTVAGRLADRFAGGPEYARAKARREQRALRRRCLQANRRGARRFCTLAVQYTTTNFADDVDEVREAMGFAQVSLRRHEEHVRTVALRANRDIPMILARLARSPERCSTGTFLSALRLLLYYPRLVDELPSMLHDAARGMHFSVLCSEDVAATTDAEIARFIESATLVPTMHACTEALSIF